MWLMIGPSGLISTLIGPTLASTEVPVAIDGRISTTSTSMVFGDPSPIVMERNASTRVPSRLPVTRRDRSSLIWPEPTMPRLIWGRPDSESMRPLVPSKAVTETRTGEPSVISRPLPSSSTRALKPSISSGALISMVGVAPTRPDTVTRSNRARVGDWVAASGALALSAGRGWNAHQARPPPAAMRTTARTTRRKIDAREMPRERCARAAARREEPRARLTARDSEDDDSELMRES